MPRWFERLLDGRTTVYAAAMCSLLIGLLFIFVWAPHPWGWQGFDHYHDIALEVAAGRPFPTMEIPWGYAYFLAGCYRLFGVRLWVPLVVQACLNALMPLLVFAAASQWTNRRTATLAALLTGLFSFNTIYASTESSDAVCTVIFMTAIVLFIAALRRRGLALYAAAGVLAGIAPQFRPNLVLVAPVLAAYAFWLDRSWRRARQVACLLVCTAAALTPWIVRNYRMTGTVMPTSVHGGVQLWYGTLQVGPYLHSRAYNPRTVFESPAFDYTSLADVPIVVEAGLNCPEIPSTGIWLAYWSDASPSERRVPPTHVERSRYRFEIPAPGRETTIYYYFVTQWAAPEGTIERTTPPAGATGPFVYFVTAKHLEDMDGRGELLDVFDVVRLLRHEAWGEPLPYADRLRQAGANDVGSTVALLLRPLMHEDAAAAVTEIGHDARRAHVTFADGSSITVPRDWRARITDLAITDGIASTVMTSRRTFRALDTDRRLVGREACLQAEDIDVNQVFYRREPHMMRRYLALAEDNVRRDPVGFVLAAAYRGLRIFVVEGAPDRVSAQQFEHSGGIYAAAEAVSIVLLLLCIAGIIIAWRRGDAVGLPLLLILLIPASLAPVLINMRYTVTIQPLMFVFIAAALTPAPRRDPAAGPASADRAGT